MNTAAATETRAIAPNQRAQDLLRTWIGLIAGISIGINFTAATRATAEGLLIRTVAGVAIMLLLMAGWSRSAAWIAKVLRLSAGQTSRYFRYDTIAAATALLTVLGAFGVRLFAPQIACLLLLMIGARAAALWAVLAREQRDELFTSNGWLAFLFLISGFAALIYQIVWQRALFAAFGVNIESITLVVSLFMFGLGIGSLAGGLIARRFAHQAPLLFLVCEFCVGGFGLVSLPLIEKVARLTLAESLPRVSAAIFALLCIPTLFMGATLPILTTHLFRHYRNLGQSVGILYSINTLGSAIACFLTADVLFVFGGQHSAIIVAATCNFAVGILVSRYAWRSARRSHPISTPVLNSENAERNYRRFLILFLSAITGYVSISQEIVWMRIIGFVSGGAPTVFAHVLGCFLIGVAAGALLGEKWCARHFAGHDRRPIHVIGIMLLTSAAFYYFSIAAVAELITWQPAVAQGAIYGIVAVTSFLLGGVFTVLCHYGARASEAAGVTVSKIYLANILGCSLAPVLSGFVLMQFMTTDRIILYLSAGAALVGGFALFRGTRHKIAGPLLAVAGIASMYLLHPAAYRDFLAKLQFNENYRPNPYSVVVENRSGIITVEASAAGGDLIYGGGMYDGRFNIDPLVDSNLISRCYMIAGLHPAPADVLEIGLSSGSWTRVMADYPLIQRLTSVEINAGYSKILRLHAGRFPIQASILDDPKVSIVIDDGRRWLNRNPHRKFDLILQNTTWHWRSEITNLLSIEYLRLCKQHLNPGGVFYYNATQSEDVPYTAAHVFAHVVHVGNFIAACDKPFDMRPEQIAENLMRFADAGHRAFSSSDARHRAALQSKVSVLAHTPTPDLAPELRHRTDLWLITDDNMATEFKRVRDDWTSGADRTQWSDGDRNWRAVFSEIRREFR